MENDVHHNDTPVFFPAALGADLEAQEHEADRQEEPQSPDCNAPPTTEASDEVPVAPLVHRRSTRSNTVQPYQPPQLPNWVPGAEPGIDTSRPYGGQPAVE